MTQVCGVDPGLHLRVAVVGDQHGQAKRAHHSLGTAQPGAFSIAHLQQFACEWHLLFVDAERGTESFSQRHLLSWNVALARPQTLQLVPQGVVLMLALLELDTRFVDVVLNIRGSLQRRRSPFLH